MSALLIQLLFVNPTSLLFSIYACMAHVVVASLQLYQQTSTWKKYFESLKVHANGLTAYIVFAIARCLATDLLLKCTWQTLSSSIAFFWPRYISLASHEECYTRNCERGYAYLKSCGVCPCHRLRIRFSFSLLYFIFNMYINNQYL